MNRIYSLLAFFIIFLFGSCISNKELHYLQPTGKTQQESTINAVVSKPYRLQVNDVLTIRIKALDQKLVDMFSPSIQQGIAANSSDALYFDGFTVNDHGIIRIPVLGEVNVIGLTAEEIRIKIEKQLLEEYFNKAADIFVSVKLAGLRYTINGEVSSPGTKTLLQEKVTILEAIANSGDITITGNRKDVMIIRQYPQGTEIHTIDLTSVDALNSPYYFIQPNDFIYVKPLKQKSWGTGKTGIESIGTIVTLLSLVTTTYLLLKR
jgi:polysaccharide biosynthesis/export protein